jgi:hypothetical protein
MIAAVFAINVNQAQGRHVDSSNADVGRLRAQSAPLSQAQRVALQQVAIQQIAGMPPAVSPERGRRVADVVSEAASNPRATSKRSADVEQKLRQLATDPFAYIDSSNRFFFADSFPDDTPENISPEGESDVSATDRAAYKDAVSPSGVPIPTGSVFQLNSRPGSTKTIYIDFDGETVSGTIWNTPTYPSVTMPPYSKDADPAFSAAELTVIREVWQAVAEDFAPFDVNVTTQRPGPEAFVRNYAGDPTYGVMAVVTTGNKAWLCGSCGGVAYVDVFADGPYYGPAWVLPSASTSTRYIANTVSHEVGHNFSLSHDGVNTTGYYGGHGNWGPIMGATSRQYSHWSRGEYAGANETEDDLAEIAARVGYLPDETVSFGNAVQIPNVLQFVSNDHIIGPFDTDYFAFDITDGQFKAVFSRSAVDPNLSPVVALYDASGQLLQTGQLINSGTIQLAATGLANGRYYLSVRGGGYLTASDGFTSYGSLGYFRVELTKWPAPTPPTNVSLTSSADRTLTASWSSTAGTGVTHTFSAQLCSVNTGLCTNEVTTTSNSATFSSLGAPETMEVRIRTTNLGGTAVASSIGPSAPVLAKPDPPRITRAEFREANDQLTVEWDRATAAPPLAVSAVDIHIRNPLIGTWVLAATGSGESGQAVMAVPSTWDSVQAEVKLVSRTTAAAPFNQSADSGIATFTIGRLSATPSPTVPTTPRTGASPAPGTGSGERQPAPQA